jgi:SAM-dependent methyltransferase
MKKEHLYESYPHNESHMRDYVEYQQKYISSVRESDRVIIEIVAELLGNRHGNNFVNLLDIGCSTGNLLRHLKRAFPGIGLTGSDLSDLQIDVCRKDPELAGISFIGSDIRALPAVANYDMIIANAILYGFDEAGFSECVASLAGALKPGGNLIAFDFFHPWTQEVAIIEKSGNFPAGHPLHFRSYGLSRSILERYGFKSIDFRPFSIPIDLPMPDYGKNSIDSYTVPTTQGEKLLFRGTIFQPWCHLVASMGSSAPPQAQ